MISVCPKTWKSATPFVDNEAVCPLWLFNTLNRKTRFLGKRSHKVCQISATFPMMRKLWDHPESTVPTPISQDHRITERFGLEGTLKEDPPWAGTHSPTSTCSVQYLDAVLFLLEKKQPSWFVVSVFSLHIHLGHLSSAFATPLLLHPICASSTYSLVSLINLCCTSKHRLGARVISNLHSLVSIDLL